MFESHFMNNKNIYCYKMYEVKFILKKNWQRKRTFIVIFYAIEKQNFELILKLSKLKQLNIIVDYKKFSCPYDLESSSFELNNVKEFSKNLIENAVLYAVITTSIAFSHEKRNVRVNALRERINSNIDLTLAIFKRFVKFQNQFSKKVIKDLTTHKNCDYVIDLENNDCFYDFLNSFLTKIHCLKL